MLQGKQIYLRAPEPEDRHWMLELENHPEWWPLSNNNLPVSGHIIDKFIESQQLNIFESRQARFIICLLNGKPAGCIDLHEFDPYHLRAGIGIIILKEHQQNGYALEALNLLTDYSFKHLSIMQLYCSIISGNNPSLALFEKAGFHSCGLRKKWYRTASGFKDEVLMQKLNPREN